MAGDWISVGASADLPETGPLIVHLDEEPEPVAIFRINGNLYGISDTCSHEDYSLGEDGDLEDHTVTCGGHGWEFDVRTGECKFPVIGIPIPAYDVKVEGEQLYIRRK